MPSQQKLTAAVLNMAKLNFDGALSLAKLEAFCEVQTYDDAKTEEVIRLADGVEILITKEMHVPAEVIEGLPATVKLICEAGTGFNNIDAEAARKKGITVCNVPTYSTEAVAHLVITYVMSLSCSLVPLQRHLSLGDSLGWRSLGSLPHFELTGKTIGLIGGRGSIGSAVSKLSLALGMKVLISSRTPQPTDADGVQYVDVPSLLQRSDFVSIHCPLTDQTQHLIGKEQLLAMKKTAFLINTARGPIINESELTAALQNGTIAGAALDVHEIEPLPVDSPLLSLPNVILTPHIGWQRVESRQRLLDTVASNCQAFVDGKAKNVVN